MQWSEGDRLFIGYCPDLFIGGVCHGVDEQNVYRGLSRLVAAEIDESTLSPRPSEEVRAGHDPRRRVTSLRLA